MPPSSFLALLTLGLMFGVARLVLQAQGAAESHAANRAITRLQAEQKRAAQTQDHLQALLDTVSAALLVVKEDGRVTGANRAARLLLRGEGPRLVRHHAPLARDAAETIAHLVPGRPGWCGWPAASRCSLRPAIFPSSGESQRLVSLQAVVGELDALQLKAWEDMSRVLAHEIMNSLTPIASLSESLSGMMRQEGASREVVEAMDTIARRSQGLAGFVARYRQVAELPEPKLQTVSLQMLADDVQALMLNGWTACTIVAASKPPVRHRRSRPVGPGGDQPAAQCGGCGRGLRKIRPSTLPAPRKTRRWSFPSSDNGKGIPAQFREDIFVPFFTTKAGGSGIGLSVVRQIALKHGGWVSAAPTPPAARLQAGAAAR